MSKDGSAQFETGTGLSSPFVLASLDGVSCSSVLVIRLVRERMERLEEYRLLIGGT